MLRKVLLLALTTGVASKLYRNYRLKHGMSSPASTADAGMGARSGMSGYGGSGAGASGDNSTDLGRS